jgi:hypothetical protein
VKSQQTSHPVKDKITSAVKPRFRISAKHRRALVVQKSYSSLYQLARLKSFEEY